ncbi:hypothetical protein B0H19DRAFT_1258059 [Mycena capillaripes]|nr:hypothetical protein B0H19DRAFT_1258059 [Mycena capillaripes]
MDTLPQELIRAIVEEIDEDESLKMCSLVSTNFREPSQRILLHALTLGSDSEDDEKSYTAAWTLLQGSPHVAPYFTQLNCLLPNVDAATADVQALCAVLGKLSHIRQSYLVGGMEDNHPWSKVPPQVAQGIADFFHRQRLEQLHVLSIGPFPKAVLALFLSAASTLTLVDASIDFSVPAIPNPPPPFTVQNLLLLTSPGIAEVLTVPELGPYVANIRKLWWDPAVESGDKLISVLAANLEHIRIHYEDREDEEALSLPPLPSLQSAEIALIDEDSDDPRLINELSCILKAAPTTLREISIMCSPNGALLPPEILAAVDSIVADSATAPRIRWRLDLEDAQEDEPELSIAVFEAPVKQAMPRLQEQGKVIVEQGSFMEEGFSAWAVNR